MTLVPTIPKLTIRLLLAVALTAVLVAVSAAPATARGTAGEPTFTRSGSGTDSVVGVLDTGLRSTGRADVRDYARGDFSASRSTSSGPGNQGADGFKYGAGCQYQCITSGVAYARMTGAELFVTTDTPAKIRIQVWGNGYFDFAESAPGSTSFSALFDDLDGGLTYQAAAYALDSAGNQSIAHGGITTLNRHVEVSMPIVEIVSTRWASGVPTAITHWANGAHRTGFSDPEWIGQFLIAGPPDVGQSAQLQLADVDPHLDLQVGVLEHNSGYSGQYCEAVGWQNMEPHVAHSNCFAQAYARATTSDHLIDLDDRPSWATSWTEHTIMTTLEVPVAGSNGLVFSAPAFIYVSYH